MWNPHFWIRKLNGFSIWKICSECSYRSSVGIPRWSASSRDKYLEIPLHQREIKKINWIWRTIGKFANSASCCANLTSKLDWAVWRVSEEIRKTATTNRTRNNFLEISHLIECFYLLSFAFHCFQLLSIAFNCCGWYRLESRLELTNPSLPILHTFRQIFLSEVKFLFCLNLSFCLFVCAKQVLFRIASSGSTDSRRSPVLKIY